MTSSVDLPRVSHELLEDIAGSAPALLWAADDDGGFIFVNARWLSFTGRSVAAECGGGWLAGVHPDDLAFCRGTFVSSVAERRPFEMEFRLRRADGEYRWMLSAGAPRCGPDGAFVGFVGSCADITDRREAEDALLEAQQQFRILTEATPNIAFISNADGSLDFANDRWQTFTGRTAQATMNWLDVLHAGDADDCARKWLAARESGDAFEGEYRLRAADGTYVWHLLRVMPRRGEAGTSAWVGSATGIDDRKQMEAELKDSEYLYRSLAEALPALVMMTSPNGEMRYCNERLLSYCGRNMDELRGSAWAELIHPEDADRGREHWLRRVQSGRQYTAEYRVRGADGAYRWHLGHTVPLKDAGGTIVGWVGATIDIDARKQAEERQRELAVVNDGLFQQTRLVAEELRRASLAKDEFLGMVSHELRTPITTIFGNAEILRRDIDALQPEERAAAVADIAQESTRLQQMIDNMFVLARLGAGREPAVEPMLVRRIIERLAAEHRLRHPGRTVTFAYDPALPPACGEATYTEQVIRNLLNNAEKYTSTEAPIEITVERRAQQLCVRVMDRGKGIDEGEADQLFAAFYRSPRTAATASGAGIGLAVCKRLVEAQGGQIWIAPRDGGGTEVAFTLPIAEEALQ